MKGAGNVPVPVPGFMFLITVLKLLFFIHMSSSAYLMVLSHKIINFCNCHNGLLDLINKSPNGLGASRNPLFENYNLLAYRVNSDASSKGIPSWRFLASSKRRFMVSLLSK